MSTHRYFVEPRQVDFTAQDPHAGLIRVTDPRGHSFALPFAPDPNSQGQLALRLGPHALSARQLRALAALLENQQRTTRTPGFSPTVSRRPEGRPTKITPSSRRSGFSPTSGESA